MKRCLGMLALAALAAAVLPGAATAEGGPPLLVADAPTEALELGGMPCNLIPVPAADEGATPVGVGSCPGVRPGAKVTTATGLCTLNFMFVDNAGFRYMGTAGHCILGTSPIGGAGDEKVWTAGDGPAAMDGSGKRIGEFAYAVLQAPKDFALIRLDPGVEANPAMCHFGGPSGLLEGNSPDPVVLEYFGNGVGIGSVLPARSAVSVGVPDADHVFAFGLALPGDSGSGVMTADGEAVGVLVTTGIHGVGFNDNGVDAGTMGITRLGPQMARAEQLLGIDLTLQTV